MKHSKLEIKEIIDFIQVCYFKLKRKIKELFDKIDIRHWICYIWYNSLERICNMFKKEKMNILLYPLAIPHFIGNLTYNIFIQVRVRFCHHNWEKDDEESKLSFEDVLFCKKCRLLISYKDFFPK